MISRTVKIMFYFFALVIAFGWIGCAKKMEVTDDDVVATWGDTAVTVENFKDKMYVRYRNDPTARKKTMDERMKVLEEYVTRDMKLAQAVELGFDQREDIRERYDEAVDRKATEILYNERIRDRLFDEKMIEEYWEHDREEVRARHILIKMDPEVTGKDTMEYWNRISEVYQKAKDGEDFERLVDRYSEDDTIDRKFHGDLGYFKWGKMVDAFQEAAWKLQPGEISPPVRTRYGYHIIKMLDRRPRGLEVNTSHILVKCTRRADPAETTAAYERAEMILKEAKKKGADFAQLARRYSEDDNTWVNGVVGYIPRGSMPSDYWDVALTMEPGEIAGPVRSYKGYHIIKCNEKRVVEESLDDPDVRNRVLGSISRMFGDTLKTLADFYLDSVTTSFDMKYNEDVVQLLLKKLNDESVPSNMNRFNSFTAEERELKVVDDKLGGLTINDLVDQYGDNAFPPQYRQDRGFIVEMVEPILIPKYLSVVAREEGLHKHPEALEDGKRALDNAMLPEIEREIIFNKSAPTEDEIKEYYEKNIDKFTSDATAAAYEILVNDRQFAEDLMNRIKNGEDITKLARRYTQRSRAKRDGGKLSSFTRDEYGAVSRRAFEMNPGELYGPLELNEESKMYSIIQLVEKNPETVKSLDEVRDQITSDLRFEKQKSIKDAWVEELKEKYNLQYNMDVIRNVWPLIEPLPESMAEARDQWSDERREIGKRAAAKRKAENEIKMKLRPGSTQTFRRDGKDVKVKIGEPRYVKDGEEVDPDKSNIKITPKGKVIQKDDDSPIKVKPVKKTD